MHCPSANMYKLSNISNKRADGWWIVQIIVLPPLASDFNRHKHCKNNQIVSLSANISSTEFIHLETRRTV